MEYENNENITSVETTIKIIEILKENGINLGTFKYSKSENGRITHKKLEELEIDGKDINKIINENNLNGQIKLYSRIANLKETYNGRRKGKITEEQVKKCIELGIIIPEKINKIEETLDLIELLSKQGIDISSIKMNKMENQKVKYTELEDINQEGIDIDKITEKYNLDKKFPIGWRIKYINDLFIGSKLGQKLKREDEVRAVNLGIINKEKVFVNSKENIIDETTETLKILKENGIDITNMNLLKKTKRGNRYLKLADIEGINEIIEKNKKSNNIYKLKKSFPIGKNIEMLKQMYLNKKESLTNLEKKEIQDIGIVKITSEEIFKATIKIPVDKYDNTSKIIKKLITEREESKYEKSK